LPGCAPALHDDGPAWRKAGDPHLTHATRLEDLRLFVGYGSDVDKMLSAGRYREVLALGPDLAALPPSY